jgi:hypothetical protein
MKMGDGNCIQAAKLQPELLDVVRQGGVLRAESNVEEQGTYIGLEEVRYARCAEESFFGFLLHKYGQFQRLKLRQVEWLGFFEAASVECLCPPPILSKSLIPHKEERHQNR